MNKTTLQKYLTETQETPKELLGHLTSLLQGSKQNYHAFTQNPKYTPYVQAAMNRGVLPQPTQQLQEHLKKVGPASEKFLEPTYQSTARKRF